MKSLKRIVRHAGAWLLPVTLGLSLTAVASEQANFATLRLSPGFSPQAGTAMGETGGHVSMLSITNQDAQGNLCLGYTAYRDMPDYLLILEADFDRLSIGVEGRGSDTTLMVSGPQGGDSVVRCDDNSGEGDNPLVEDSSWPAGEYAIWVGAKEANQRHSYKLVVEP
ncbi:hypothetical protein [Geitlerinema sp. PCC 9228]|uniref:hypothetical protein n=1 Tax=Geitlerinema sp. PCC 9228 TaxID=111611 RepID=UPI0008F985E0|nr:hypothetical protein [Geitlerinema sp. PCC 9228]